MNCGIPVCPCSFGFVKGNFNWPCAKYYIVFEVIDGPGAGLLAQAILSFKGKIKVSKI